MRPLLYHYSHRVMTNQQSLGILWGTVGVLWVSNNDALALKPYQSSNEGFVESNMAICTAVIA